MNIVIMKCLLTASCVGFGLLLYGTLIYGVLRNKADREKPKKLDELLAGLSKEDLDELKRERYYVYEKNSNFLQGTSLIYELIPEPGRIKIGLLYYDNGKEAYDIDYVYMKCAEYRQENYQVGEIVETIHNRAIEVRLKIKEIKGRKRVDRL